MVEFYLRFVADGGILSGVEDRLKVLEWLAPLDQSKVQNAALDSREPGTGAWFLEGESFEAWINSPSSVFWLYGSGKLLADSGVVSLANVIVVGSGKTVLSSSIIQKLQFACQSPNSAGTYDALAYFYFSFQDDNRQDLGALLKVFIAQLCPPNSVFPELRRLYDKCHQRYPPGAPSDSDLRSTFVSIITGLSSRTALTEQSPESQRDDNTAKSVTTSETFLVIDALDEIPFGPQRDRALDLLTELSALNLPHLHILVTSRDKPDIREALMSNSGFKSVSLNNSSVQADIGTFVSRAVQRDAGLRPSEQLIKEYLVGDPKGIPSKGM